MGEELKCCGNSECNGHLSPDPDDPEILRCNVCHKTPEQAAKTGAEIKRWKELEANAKQIFEDGQSDLRLACQIWHITEEEYHKKIVPAARRAIESKRADDLKGQVLPQPKLAVGELQDPNKGETTLAEIVKGSDSGHQPIDTEKPPRSPSSVPTSTRGRAAVLDHARYLNSNLVDIRKLLTEEGIEAAQKKYDFSESWLRTKQDAGVLPMAKGQKMRGDRAARLAAKKEPLPAQEAPVKDKPKVRTSKQVKEEPTKSDTEPEPEASFTLTRKGIDLIIHDALVAMLPVFAEKLMALVGLKEKSQAQPPTTIPVITNIPALPKWSPWWPCSVKIKYLEVLERLTIINAADRLTIKNAAEAIKRGIPPGK